MSDPTWTDASTSRRRSERGPPDAGSPGPDAPADDWLASEIDWDEGERPDEERSQGTAREGRGARTGLIPVAHPGVAGSPSVDVERLAEVRRRRLAALAVLGLLFVLAVVIPLVVFGGNGNPVAQTTPLTTSQLPTTTTQPPATTTTPTTTTTQTNPSQATTLRITLPDKGSLRRGDRGSEVETLQRALAALGFAAGEPDGVFGQLTQAAVVDFQQSNNLDPDGVVGTDTVRLLNSALAKRGITASEAGAG